jgi:glutamate carboxypeptidase
MGLRFSTSQDEQALLAAFASLSPSRPEVSLQVNQLSHRPPWVADSGNTVAAALAAHGRRLGMRLEMGTSGGAGDTNLTGAAAIPTVDGLGPEGAGAHSPSEQASLKSLLQRAALLASYLC